MALILTSSVAFAASPLEETAFEHAISLYDEADFATAIVELDALNKTLDRDLRERSKLYMAMCYLGLNDKEHARAAVLSLLEANPDFNLPPFPSPVVRSFFDEIKKTHVVVPLLDHVPPLEVQAEAALTLAVTVQRMLPSYTLKLHYRFARHAPYEALDVALRELSYEVRLPAAFVVAKSDGAIMQYYFTVEANGETIGLLRSDKRPYEIPVAPAKPVVTVPTHKQWWFWTSLVLGAATVAAATAGAAVYVRDHSPSDAAVTVRF